MNTVYQAVQLPAVAGPVQWLIEPRGTGRVRLRAVVAALTVDARDQFSIAISRPGQEKLISATGDMTVGGTVVFGIGFGDCAKPTMISTGSPTVAQGPLHDIWLSDAYTVTLNAITNNITVATIGCWVDYE